MYVIDTVAPTDVAGTGEFDARKVWIGADARGVGWRSWPWCSRQSYWSST
jgi:hypothetical protein